MDCNHFQEMEILGSEVSRELFESSRRTGKPCAGSIELTAECNLRCIHCYNLPVSRSRNLPAGKIAGIIDELVEAEVLCLLLTGGDPLTRPDFADIYKYVRQKGIMVTVFTNGTLVTQKIASVFRDHLPLDVEVSVYGATEATYEKFTGVKGSFHKCIEGIQKLLQHEIPVTIKAVLTKANHHEFASLERMAHQLGTKFRYSTMIFPRLDGNRDVLDLRLSCREILEYDFGDPLRHEALSDLINETGLPSNEEREFLYLCGAALTTFHIDCTGSLCACVRERRHAVSLLDMPFAEAFGRLSKAIREETVGKNYKCRYCNFIIVCDQCPAAALLETGTPEGISPYTCELGQERGKRLYSRSPKS